MNQKSTTLLKFKWLIVLSTFLLVSFNATTYAQKIDLKYKVDSVMLGEKVQYKITISIKDNIEPWNVSFYEQLPNKNYRLIDRKEKISGSSCTIITTERRKWLVMVEYNNQSEAKLIH